MMDKKSIYGKVFHLTLNMERECFVCHCQIDQMLNNISYEELLGFIPKMEELANPEIPEISDSMVFTLRAEQKFQNEDLENL